MSNPNPPKSAWYPPNDWPVGNNWTVTVPQDESSFMEQQSFGSVDSAWFGPSMGAFAPPVHLRSVPSPVSSGIGMLPGPVSQTSLGRASNGNGGPLSTIYGGSEAVSDGHSMTIGIQAMQVPIGHVIHNTERYDGQRELSSEREDVAQALRCGWRGCHAESFGRKAELKRHVETKHISPNSHKCLWCRRTFNRSDNLKEHVRRVHGRDI